jgi:drug/metabolite transporter (DMT)-like permease
VFFTGLAGAAFLEAIPLFMTEIVAGAFYWPSLKGWLILVFVVLGPSLSSQITYMRGIELIGPGRAGLFNSLVPVFGALFAVLLLGEPFAPYHAVALGLGMGGVYFAERKA